MKYLVSVLSAAALLLAYTGVSEAGAKDGKQRWTHKQTGSCKAHPPLKVPAAEDGKPGTIELKIVFKAKELAEFVLIGDGDTDLDVIVLDAKGKKVVEDVDPAERGSDLCVCRWTPDEEMEYRIVIVNHGKVYNVAQAGCN
jgi:hypothetical protein